MISRTGLLAIHALAELGKHADEVWMSVEDLATSISAPQNYLGKLLQRLVRERLVLSRKGQGGGWRLAKPAAAIRLREVLAAVDDADRWRTCVLSNPECSDTHPCALHDRWKSVRSEFEAFLDQTTVADAGQTPGPVGLPKPVRRAPPKQPRSRT